MAAIRHPPDVLFLDECRSLSVTARAMLAALVLERFCVEEQLAGLDIDAFLNHHWRWIDEDAEFDEWAQAKPPSVAGEPRFRTVLESVDATLSVSMYGAAENELTMEALQSAVAAARLSQLPPVTPFKFSRFCDGNGWGEPLTIADRDFWRSLRVTYARAAR